MEEGTIIGTVHRTKVLGKYIEEVTYKWEGGPKCKMRWEFIEQSNPRIVKYSEDKHQIQLGPYILHVIEDDVMRGEYVCIREDYPFWYVVVWWHNSTRWLDLVYRRLIVTLSIWGLAEYTPAASWHDIYLIQWLKRKPKREKS